MQLRLDPASNGRFLMNNQPIQRGSVKVTYQGGTVTIQDQYGGIWENIPYDAILNGADGEFFPSMADLIAFIDENFYQA